MENSNYRRFLKQEAEDNPVNIERYLDSRRLRISWESNNSNEANKKTSDILDSLYLGKPMNDVVTVERRVAGMLQERLMGLEEQNINLRHRLKMVNISLVIVVVGMIISLIAFLSAYLPPISL